MRSLTARRADISLTDQALVDSSGNGGGRISIRGSSFVVSEQSIVIAHNRGASDAVGGIGLDADRVQLTGGSAMTTDVLGSGQGGDLRVSAAEVRLSDGSIIGTAVFDRGNAGQVRIAAGSVEVLEGGEIHSLTFARGDAGEIAVEADRLLIQGGGAEAFTGVANSAEVGSSGAAGIVRIAAGELEVLDGGEIRSSTFSEGDAAGSRSGPIAC